MRILHVITSLRSGGAERLLTELLPRLRGDGREVAVLVMDGTETDFMRQLRAQGIRVMALGHGYRQMRNPLLVFKLRRALKGYDIVHTHNTACQLLVAMAARRGQVLVTTEHNATNRRRGHKWLRGVDQWMYSRYRMVICVSESTEQGLREWCPGARTTVISNGIDLERFAGREIHHGGTEDTEGYETQTNGNHNKQFSPWPPCLRGERIVVSMVAGFRKQKDHATLLRAMALLPAGVELWLAGEGETMAEMQALAQELGVMDRVKFLGRCEDIPAILKQSDIAVLSSHYEGQPMSLIEAMAAGLPVVASDVAGIHETVGDAGILVPHGDAEALAEAIRRLAENEGLRRELSGRSQRRAAEFSIDATVAGYLDVYTTETRRTRRIFDPNHLNHFIHFHHGDTEGLGSNH